MPEKSTAQQSIFVDEFMFYFMRLRKCHCRHIVGRLKRKYPAVSPVLLAERLVNAQSLLSFTAGALSNMPAEILPGNRSMRLIGIAGGSVVLTRMHIELILKIALIFGYDIDAKERVPEIIAVIAATIPALLLSGGGRVRNDSGLYTLAGSGIGGAACAYILGRVAISYYHRD